MTGKEEEKTSVEASVEVAGNVVDEESREVDSLVDVELGTAGEEEQLSLFVEAYEALNHAFLMFCIPDLRAIANEGRLQGDPEMIRRIIELPASLADIYTVFALNIDLLTEERLKDAERAEMYREALGLYKIKEFEGDDRKRLEAMDAIRCIVFDDENEEEEIVYAVYVSLPRKRISVVFRGSVTDKDFVQDAKVLPSSLRNPVKGDSSLPEQLGVHLGFREYLFDEKKIHNSFGSPSWRGESTEKQVADAKRKYEIILEQVKALAEAHPEYNVMVAGHSLGGALATLFALEAAADDRLPKPITCITSGAPMVGNSDFLLAFESLERRKQLRCLHVANDRDPVTRSPPNGVYSPFHAMFCQRRRFRHVGLRLKFREDGYVITYPMKPRSYLGILCCDCMQIGRACLFTLFTLPILFLFPLATLKWTRKHHTQLKYMRRLMHNEEDLSQIFIDEMYQMRWDLPAYRMPVLRVGRHRRYSCNWCARQRPEDITNGE